MTSPTSVPSRRRLPREARTRQLLEASWALIGDEGTDALTLGRLADVAGITKPVVYDHFGTRNGLLAALYLRSKNPARSGGPKRIQHHMAQVPARG